MNKIKNLISAMMPYSYVIEIQLSRKSSKYRVFLCVINPLRCIILFEVSWHRNLSIVICNIELELSREWQ